MKKAVLMLVVAFFCFAAFMSGQQRYNEYVLDTWQGKVWVNEEIGTPSVGVSVDDLLGMVFHADEIPGFYCVSTRARLNLGGFLTRLEREWFHEDHKIRGKAPPFYFVDVDLKVYPNTERAKKEFYVLTRSGPRVTQERTFREYLLGKNAGTIYHRGLKDQSFVLVGLSPQSRST